MRLGVVALLLAAGCGGPPPPAPAAPIRGAETPPPAPSPPSTPSSSRPTPAVPLPLRGGGSPPAPSRLPAPGEDPDFPAKVPAGPHDWLARFDEEGQTPAEYRSSCRNRKTAERRIITLHPLGAAAERRGPLLGKVCAYAAVFFGTEAVLGDPLPLPSRARDAARGQWSAERILVDLGGRIEERDLAVLGFCEEDLFAEGLNFVFGLADPRRRCGAWSLSRFGGDDEGRLLRRVLQVATHEAGHLLGLEHCIRYECLMNGSNSLAESDRTPLHACPECHEKLRWNLGFDPAGRWEALADFYGEHGLEGDRDFARRRAGKAAVPR